MRFVYTLCFVSVMSVAVGCKHASEEKSTTAEIAVLEQSLSDTLVYSSPANYNKTLDNPEAAEKVEISSYEDIFNLYEKLNYTPEAWQAGIREVPRVYLPLIGDKWGTTRSKEITVENKKRLFFRTLAPLVLRANELITVDRKKLGELKSSFEKTNTLNEEDQAWILKLAKLYRVSAEDGQVSASLIDVLWKKVDIVPVSLALAQAAEESGWGTSRFAAQGNAVYGQWTWGSNAIKPEQQRKELGNYGIASFGTLQESVCAYMLNLNTHNAYASLRDKRADLRQNNEKITGHILAGQLTKYSERGEEYVKSLRSLMDYNRLGPADDAYLSKDPPIYFVPKAD